MLLLHRLLSLRVGRILRPLKNPHEVIYAQTVQAGDDRHASGQLGDHPVPFQVFRQHLIQEAPLAILGGRGHYAGVVAGTISLVALVSVLLAMNMPNYGRSIIYGVIILALLLLYGREAGET